MAQHYWVPDPAEVGGAPTGWAVLFGNDTLTVRQDAGGEYYVERVGSSNTVSAVALQTIDGADVSNVATYEIFGHYVIQDESRQDFRQVLNFTGTALSNAVGRGGGLEQTNTTTQFARLTSIDGTGNNEAQFYISPVLGPGVTVLQRTWSNGNDHKTRIWDGSLSEPATWDVEITSSVGVQASGQVGQYRYWSDEIRIYGVGIGTDGDAAPTAPAAGPNAPINPSVTNLLATSARLNWEQG